MDKHTTAICVDFDMVRYLDPSKRIGKRVKGETRDEMPIGTNVQRFSAVCPAILSQVQ